MCIVVDSLTGMGRRYAESLGWPIVDIQDEAALSPDEDYFLVTRCYNFGEMPFSTRLFLEAHHEQVVACAVSGNRNWGANYAIVGDKIEAEYGIPCVAKFEGMGFAHERQLAQDYLAAYKA